MAGCLSECHYGEEEPCKTLRGVTGLGECQGGETIPEISFLRRDGDNKRTRKLASAPVNTKTQSKRVY